MPVPCEQRRVTASCAPAGTTLPPQAHTEAREETPWPSPVRCGRTVREQLSRSWGQRKQRARSPASPKGGSLGLAIRTGRPPSRLRRPADSETAERKALTYKRSSLEAGCHTNRPEAREPPGSSWRTFPTIGQQELCERK